MHRTRSSTHSTASTVVEPYFDEPGCIIPYCICTCYNRLPEDEPSVSKHVHVKDTVKNQTEVHFVGLHYDYITMHSASNFKKFACPCP